MYRDRAVEPFSPLHLARTMTDSPKGSAAKNGSDGGGGRPNGLNIILFGPPGVGKGAQAQLLSYNHDIVHLSTGDVIRDEIARGSPLGQRVREAVGRGEFADDETVLGIVMSRVDLPEYQNGFVMDGFPRTIRQAELFGELLADRGRKVSHAFFITAPEATILQRLGGRRICSKCGRTYHKEFRRPKIHGICDYCKSKVVRRHDDDPDTHRERLRTYNEKTLPLVEYYRRTGSLVEIDGNQGIDQVHDSIEKVIAARKEA
jgi:adenylate kinase